MRKTTPSDPLKATLEPLAREPLAPGGDVSAWVMADVRALPRRAPREAGDRFTLWAATLAAAAAVAVGAMTFEPARRLYDGDALAGLSRLEARADASLADPLDWN